MTMGIDCHVVHDYNPSIQGSGDRKIIISTDNRFLAVRIGKVYTFIFFFKIIKLI